MTAIEKVLKRKDIASVVVAIVLGFAISNLLSMITLPLTTTLIQSDSYGSPTLTFTEQYTYPLVSFLLTIIALELLLRVVIFSRQVVYKKGKK